MVAADARGSGGFVRGTNSTCACGASRGSTVDRRWRRRLDVAKDPEVIAYAFFDASTDARPPRPALPPRGSDRSTRGPARIDPVPLDADGTGGTHTTDADAAHPVFLDLAGPAARRAAAAGLLDAEGAVAADGNVIYVAWWAEAKPDPVEGFSGLSLMDGDDPEVNEYLFAGRGTDTSFYACHLQRYDRAIRAPGDLERARPLDAAPAAPGLQPAQVDGAPRRWVLEIRFRPGRDSIRAYLDPPAGASLPGSPNLTIENLDLRFDRLRLVSSAGASARFGRILIGTTYAAVAGAGR